LVKSYIDAQRALDSDDLEFAERLIFQEMPETAEAFQFRAKFYLKQGKAPDAVWSLQRAIELLPDPELSISAAAIAASEEMYPVAREILSKAIEANPDHHELRSKMAALLLHSRNHLEAIPYLESLWLSDHSYDTGINLARSLALVGRLDESLSILRAVPASEDPLRKLNLVLSQTFVLRALDKQADAFELLDSNFAEFDSNLQFLAEFMQQAFASDNDERAGSALKRIAEIQADSPTPNAIFTSKSIDEFIEMAKEHRDRQDKIAEMILRGQIPWTMSDSLMNKQWALLGWSERTQVISNLPRNPLRRAELTTYCTNSFHVAPTGTSKSLEPLEAPQCDDIVIDISALITLFKLGQLSLLEKSYKRIMYPSSYLRRFLKENSRMASHQPSRERAAKAVRNALVSIVSTVSTASHNPILEEYDSNAETRGFNDILAAMTRKGRLTQQDFEKFSAILGANKPTSEIPLEVGETITVGYQSILALAQHDILEKVAKSFNLQIRDDDAKRIDVEIRNIEATQALRNSYKELQRFLLSSKTFVSSEVASRRGLITDDEIEDDIDEGPQSPLDDESLAAYSLARDLGVPLLVDDRVIESLFNTESGGDLRSFHSYAFLESMLGVGRISVDTLAEATLRLIEWRYRFLVVGSEVLWHCVTKHKDAFPGEDLLEVAGYCHDSICDPALPYGIEASNDEMSIAERVFVQWILSISELLAELWLSNVITNEEATRFTEWIAIELCPGPPIFLHAKKRNLLELSILRAIVIKLAVHPIDNYPRLRLGIQVMCRALGYDEARLEDLGLTLLGEP